ncbi:MAG TPA: metallophosphoesterase family protein, partial [Thermomicrobiaceae bacterium]|nr:metallophosphoesterase family protein [Thermomicrobiaceae bacterium]
TIQRLMAIERPIAFVRGNADRELVERFDQLAAGEPDIPDEEDAPGYAGWCARRLSRAQRDFLASFRDTASYVVDGLGSVLFCHGSPRSDTEIITAITPEARFAPMVADAGEDIVVCGHTHVQFDRFMAGKRVLNAGSVGMPYESAPGAYWLLLGPEVEHRHTTYDLEQAAEAVRSSGYPIADELAGGNILQVPSAEEATLLFERMATEDDPQ